MNSVSASHFTLQWNSLNLDLTAEIGWTLSRCLGPGIRDALLKGWGKSIRYRHLASNMVHSKRSLLNPPSCSSEHDRHAPGGARLENGLQPTLESRRHVPFYITFHSLRLLNFLKGSKFHNHSKQLSLFFCALRIIFGLKYSNHVFVESHCSKKSSTWFKSLMLSVMKFNSGLICVIVVV